MVKFLLTCSGPVGPSGPPGPIGPCSPPFKSHRDKYPLSKV